MLAVLPIVGGIAVFYGRYIKVLPKRTVTLTRTRRLILLLIPILILRYRCSRRRYRMAWRRLRRWQRRALRTLEPSVASRGTGLIGRERERERERRLIGTGRHSK